MGVDDCQEERIRDSSVILFGEVRPLRAAEGRPRGRLSPQDGPDRRVCRDSAGALYDWNTVALEHCSSYPALYCEPTEGGPGAAELTSNIGAPTGSSAAITVLRHRFRATAGEIRMDKGGEKGKEGRREETEREREEREAGEVLERERRLIQLGQLMQAGLGSSKSARSAPKTRAKEMKTVKTTVKAQPRKPTAGKSTRGRSRKGVNRYGETAKEECFRLWDEIEEMVGRKGKKKAKIQPGGARARGPGEMNKKEKKPNEGRDGLDTTTDTDSDSEIIVIGPEDSDFDITDSENDSDKEGEAPPILGGINHPIVV